MWYYYGNFSLVWTNKLQACLQYEILSPQQQMGCNKCAWRSLWLQNSKRHFVMKASEQNNSPDTWWRFWVQRLVKCLWQTADNFAATLYLRPKTFQEKMAIFFIYPPCCVESCKYAWSRHSTAQHSTSLAFVAPQSLTLSLRAYVRISPNLEAKCQSIKGKVTGSATSLGAPFFCKRNCCCAAKNPFVSSVLSIFFIYINIPSPLCPEMIYQSKSDIPFAKL